MPPISLNEKAGFPCTPDEIHPRANSPALAGELPHWDRRKAMSVARAWRGRLVLVLVGGCGFLAPSVRVWGQATTGSILGCLLDPSGGLVGGANIRVQNQASGLAQTGRSSSQGEYSISGLPPGVYTLTVSKEGFATVARPGLELA